MTVSSRATRQGAGGPQLRGYALVDARANDEPRRLDFVEDNRVEDNRIVAGRADLGEVEPVVVRERSPCTLVGPDIGRVFADVEFTAERPIARQHGDLRIVWQVADLVDANPGVLVGAGRERREQHDEVKDGNAT